MSNIIEVSSKVPTTFSTSRWSCLLMDPTTDTLSCHWEGLKLEDVGARLQEFLEETNERDPNTGEPLPLELRIMRDSNVDGGAS